MVPAEVPTASIAKPVPPGPPGAGLLRGNAPLGQQGLEIPAAAAEK